MKKTIFILTTFTALMLSGCKNWVDDFTISPNSPVSVTNALLLTTSEVATFALYNGQLDRTGNIMTQQLAGTLFQMEEVGKYNITENDNINEWKTVYADALINMKTLIENAGDANPYYRGIGRVLKCMVIGIATDYWGDIPYSDALNGLEGPGGWNPVYDTQEQIIAAIQSELDQAITDLSQLPTANTLLPGTDDYIHGGDVAAWIKTAYIIKMRYANRESNRDASGSAQNALDYFNAAGLADGDDTYAIYGINGNELNPFNSFNTTRAGYIKMGGFFVDLLTSLNDPRLPLYAAPDPSGNYTGTPLGTTADTTSNTGSLLSSDASPIPLATYSEALFIKAEAHLRLGQAQEAADAYNLAVKASILRTTGAPDAAYEAANASETSGSITLEKIMTQAYIDLFLQPEAYADQRRTDIPALTPNPVGLLTGIPKRLPTSIDERVNNSNAIVVSDLLTPVWWDN